MNLVLFKFLLSPFVNGEEDKTIKDKGPTASLPCHWKKKEKKKKKQATCEDSQ